MADSAYSVESDIRYNDVDQFGKTRSIAMIQKYEEAAIEHCRTAGKDVFSLLGEGYGWVLRGGSLLVERYPSYNEQIRIDTWISRWTPFQGVREFVMKDAEGAECSIATSVWAYIDLRNRRPCPVPEVFREKWEFSERRAIPAQLIKRPLEMPGDHSTDVFSIRRFDIDSNNHVHNVRYLEWVLESVPEEYYDDHALYSVEGSFLMEARRDDGIIVNVGRKGENELIHNVVRREDGAVLATGCSKWKKR